MKKKVVIVGSSGQDGTLLSEKLCNDGHSICAIDLKDVKFLGKREDSAPVALASFKTPTEFGESIHFEREQKIISELIGEFQPQELYYLAAFHHSSEDKGLDDDAYVFQKSFETNVTRYQMWLDAIFMQSKKTRVFYAASSLVFGSQTSGLLGESSSYQPDSFYGLSKTAGIQLGQFYREKRGLFVSNGILFNHESHLRPLGFISKKIVNAAFRISQGHKEKLKVGHLEAQVDWGYAPDYVEAFEKILFADKADEFVVASGHLHTVREFIEVAFSQLNLAWQDWVQVDESVVVRSQGARQGDISKIRKQIGWSPKTSFEEMIRRMIASERELSH